MEALFSLVNEQNVITFFLLYIRMAGLFLLMPIFSHVNVPMSVKAMLALLFTMLFFSTVTISSMPTTLLALSVAIFQEMMLGLLAGVLIQIAIGAIVFAGGQISFIMGFSLASAIDPQSGVSMPIVSQFLSLLTVMLLLSFNFHHLIIMLAQELNAQVPLGYVAYDVSHLSFIMTSAAKMFMIGFMIAFPITALSLLSDVIFGMLMKSMPQFNLLVIGFPIKIAVSFAVLVATLVAILSIEKSFILEQFNLIHKLF